MIGFDSRPNLQEDATGRTPQTCPNYCEMSQGTIDVLLKAFFNVKQCEVQLSRRMVSYDRSLLWEKITMPLSSIGAVETKPEVDSSPLPGRFQAFLRRNFPGVD